MYGLPLVGVNRAGPEPLEQPRRRTESDEAPSWKGGTKGVASSAIRPRRNAERKPSSPDASPLDPGFGTDGSVFISGYYQGISKKIPRARLPDTPSSLGGG